MNKFDSVGKRHIFVFGKSVYIETSIVSYLTALPSSDILVAAWQKTTNEWWKSQRRRFDLFTSAVVIEEASRGDTIAAAKRLKALAGISLLVINEPVRMLSKSLLEEGALPSKAIDDSLHIAISAVHGIDYLLTWNCRHIDNAEMKPIIRNVCVIHGHTCPEICTPQELMGVNNND